jgi:hypothetical protein
MIYAPHQHYLDEELEYKEIGSACSTFTGENRFWCGNLKSRLGRIGRTWEDNIRVDLK